MLPTRSVRTPWERICAYARREGLTTWLGVDVETGHVVAQVNDSGQIVWEGRGHTSNAAIGGLLADVERDAA